LQNVGDVMSIIIFPAPFRVMLKNSAPTKKKGISPQSLSTIGKVAEEHNFKMLKPHFYEK